MSGDCQLKGAAGKYDNEYIDFFHFDEQGLLLANSEYFNPLIVAGLRIPTMPPRYSEMMPPGIPI